MTRPWPSPPPPSTLAAPQPGPDVAATPRATVNPELATTTPADPVAMHHLDLDLGPALGLGLDGAHPAALLPPGQPGRGSAARSIYGKRNIAAPGARPPRGIEIAATAKPQLELAIDIVPSDKRTLDPNVLDDDSTTPRPTLEQDP